MLLSTSSITKFHGDKCILKEISFSIEERDKIAIIGVNGTGKSTFLKILANKEDYVGNIIQKRDISINYLEQNSDFKNTYTIMEQANALLSSTDISTYEIEKVLNKFGIQDYTQKISTLSGGQKKRISLAITLLKPCDLLILDEPTNHLDNSMIDYLEKYLIKFNKALVMVTHDRYFLNRVTNKIYEIDSGDLIVYPGNYSTYLALKQKREEELAQAQRKLNSFLKKELEWVNAGVQARSTKSKDRLQRFEKLSSTKRIKAEENLSLIHVFNRLGKKTIELDNIGLSFGDRRLFDSFSYTFKRNDRIGILGDNGVGKSSLLNILSNTLSPTSGSVIHGETVKIGYFQQTNTFPDENKSVIDYINDTSHYMKTSEGEFSAKQMCERFLFDSQLQHTTIKRLSGGEKRRLYLLSILLEGPNVLLLDEPTNDLDIQTLTILEDYLDHFDGIIVTVSHDRYFIDRVCDSIFVIKDEQIHKYNGGYSTNIDISTKTTTNKGDGAARYAQEKLERRQSQPRLTSKEKQELESMEETLSIIEIKISDIDASLELQGSDFEKIRELSDEREKLEQLYDEKSERWMKLLEIQEQVDALKN